MDEGQVWMKESDSSFLERAISCWTEEKLKEVYLRRCAIEIPLLQLFSQLPPYRSLPICA